MNYGFIITTYNRSNYLKECLESVKRANIPADKVLIVDDASTDTETLRLIHDFDSHTIYKKNRSGIKNSLFRGYEYWFNEKNIDLVINLDADAVIRNDAIEVLLDLKKRFPDNIVSGFNTTVKNRNPILEEHEDYFLKKYASGICLCINRYEYERYFLPALQRPTGNFDFDASLIHAADGKGVVTAKPSICQHIGMISAMGHATGGEPPDVAEDFKPLALKNVTLIGATGDEVKKAIEISTKYIEFGAINIIPNLKSKADYNKHILKHLTDYFDTDFCLLIQPDGYVLNWKAWTNDFVNYEYIGARWHFTHPEYQNFNVGNGGFSLRSKGLCNILSDDVNIIPQNDSYIRNFEEDHNISKIYRRYLEGRYAIQFAPPEVADRFSIEAYGVRPPNNRYNWSFGFHGFGNVDYSGLKMEHIPVRQTKQFVR